MKEPFFTVDCSRGIGYGGTPTYIEEEQSLSYVPFNHSADFSIMLGSSYVGLDLSLTDGLVSHLSGLAPRCFWTPVKLDLPAATPGKLYAHVDALVVRGGGIRYLGEWKTYFCSSHNCLCIGNPVASKKYFNVEFAQKLIAVVDRGVLAALWVML